MFALSRFISFFTVTQCMSGTSVWTLDNVAPFWLNEFSLCCLDESSVDIVDICFYCHPHCMLSMCGVWRSLCGGTGPDNHYNGLMAGAGVGAKGSGVHTDTLNTLPGTLHCSRYLDRGTPHSDTLIWIGRWQTTPQHPRIISTPSIWIWIFT